MSTMYPIADISLKSNFSHALIMRVLAEYLKKGVYAMDVKSEGQVLSIDFNPARGLYSGSGAINEEKGAAIAAELQGMYDSIKFIKDHFQFINIGVTNAI